MASGLFFLISLRKSHKARSLAGKRDVRLLHLPTDYPVALRASPATVPYRYVEASVAFVVILSACGSGCVVDLRFAGVFRKMKKPERNFLFPHMWKLC